jgi:hypothetical protein
MSRKELNAESLDDFQPRRQQASQRADTSVADPSIGWSRREAPIESQFTIRARVDTIERFKQMCRPSGGGRFTYGEMLERLMNQADGQN